jgi:hypothetical protein
MTTKYLQIKHIPPKLFEEIVKQGWDFVIPKWGYIYVREDMVSELDKRLPRIIERMLNEGRLHIQDCMEI